MKHYLLVQNCLYFLSFCLSICLGFKLLQIAGSREGPISSTFSANVMAGTRGRSDGPYFTGARKNPRPVFNKPACKHWVAMQSICLVYPSPPLSSNNNLYLELFFYKWLSSNSAFILPLLTQTPKPAFSIPLWQSQGNRYHSRSWSSLWFSLETELGAHLSPALWTAYIFSLNLPF